MRRTIGALYRESVAYLAAAGIDEAAYEARALLAHILDRPLNDILLEQDRPTTRETEIIVGQLLALRAARMPLAYVTRTAYFCGLRLRCDNRAFIPRPETEELVEAVSARIAACERLPSAVIADIGCGTGAIGLSLATRFPSCRVVLTDISAAALELAAENAELLGLNDRVLFLPGSYLEPLCEAGLAERIAIIVCNPPYVRPHEWPGLAPEIHAEPKEALVASSADGLEAFRILAAQAPLFPNLQLLACECGYGQAAAVVDIFAPLGNVEIIRDLAGIERIVIVDGRPTTFQQRV